MPSEAQLAAVLNLHLVGRYAVEAFDHAERLLVGNDLYLGIIFSYQFYGTAVVGFHVVYHQIVYLAVAYHLLDVLDIWHEEVYLDCVDEAHFLIDNEVRVVRNSVRQRPQALKELLVAVVDAYIIDVVFNLNHGSNKFIWFIVILFSWYGLPSPAVVAACLSGL